MIGGFWLHANWIYEGEAGTLSEVVLGGSDGGTWNDDRRVEAAVDVVRYAF